MYIVLCNFITCVNSCKHHHICFCSLENNYHQLFCYSEVRLLKARQMTETFPLFTNFHFNELAQ